KRPPRTHDALAVRLETVGADRRVGDHTHVVPVPDNASRIVLPVIRPGELEGAEDVVLDLAVVGVEVFPPDRGDGEGADLAEKDAASVELVAAQLGHQAAAGALVETPADQLLHVPVVELPTSDALLQRLPVFGLDGRAPAVVVDRNRSVLTVD